MNPGIVNNRGEDMKKFKLAFALLLVIPVVAMFAGCGKKTDWEVKNKAHWFSTFQTDGYTRSYQRTIDDIYIYEEFLVHDLWLSRTLAQMVSDELFFLMDALGHKDMNFRFIPADKSYNLYFGGEEIIEGYSTYTLSSNGRLNWLNELYLESADGYDYLDDMYIAPFTYFDYRNGRFTITVDVREATRDWAPALAYFNIPSFTVGFVFK